MKQIATVVEGTGSIAVVKVERSSMCDGCHKRGCDGGCDIYSIFGGDKSFTADAVNRAGAKKGDTVVIETADRNVYLSSFIVFILPLLLGFVSYAFARSFFAEHTSVLIAFAVFAVYFAALAVTEQIRKKQKNTKLVIVTVLSSENKDI